MTASSEPKPKGNQMEQKPTVGRTVHFVPPQECTAESTLAFYAAIITQVNPGSKGVPGDDLSDKPETVEIATLGPNSLYFQHAIPYSSELKPGCWSWPARA